MPRQRDIYLAPFPFSDEDAEKLRPVLVITNTILNAGGQDVIVMAITSNLDPVNAGLEFNSASLEEGTLPRPSRILPLKVYTVAQKRLGRYFGRLSSETFRDVLALLDAALQPL